MTDDGSSENLIPKEPTAFAMEIDRLRTAALETVQKREFIPQPLFWSLFFSELDKVKREREQIHAIKEVLSRLG